MFAGIHGCISSTDSPSTDKESIIDSLIQSDWINEKLLMLSFGAESVSAINTDKGIVLIDAGISTGLTQLYREKIEQSFQNKAFALVINTHAHHDHYRGNSVFADAVIVGHENGLEEIDQYWKDPDQIKQSLKAFAEEHSQALKNCQPYSDSYYFNLTQRIRYQEACRDVKKKIQIREPKITFQDSLTLDMGDITFELMYFGSCHSGSDILIYVPELKVLFSGDLIHEYGRPDIRYREMTHMEQWRKAIRWISLRMDNMDKVIGGHGQVLTLDDLMAFKRIIIEKTQ